MIELDMTPEQQALVVTFAGGMALSTLHEIINTDAPIFAIDLIVRNDLIKWGFSPSEESWRSDYFDYICTLISEERFGMRTTETVSKIVSEFLAVASMSVMNLPAPVVVGIVPVDDNLTVPEEWIEEF